MPNIKSAKKRVEISAKRKETNSKFKGAMKTAIKKVAKTADQVDLKDAVKKIDKALKRGIIKKNTADRKKSRITKSVNKAK
ncbi:MAG: 30S ribosomal protein S20 [Bacilli bacterium]|nr:30S ribosomal protein S20 [Bacilli bacterium]MDD4298518.1 30S ribosomal protein S20 [Bacilli bacterium]